MCAASDRFRDAGRSSAGGTPAVPSRSAGVPPAFDLAANEGKAIRRSRGYLPHFDGPNLVQHIVFRLADSLPAQTARDIAGAQRRDRVLAVDAALDSGYGRRDLARSSVAALVQTALLAFDGERYVLIAWCVMPNHVHVLLAIKLGLTLDRIVHSWKSYTAKEANRVLGRVGRFWAPEYFDRFMRDDEHLARTAAYIEGNPVKAGLCESVGDWQFSSAWRGWGGRDARGPQIHP
jgi:REP element-mobilizing transposase RayT